MEVLKWKLLLNKIDLARKTNVSYIKEAKEALENLGYMEV